jgi:hypothetical protein
MSNRFAVNNPSAISQKKRLQYGKPAKSVQRIVRCEELISGTNDIDLSVRTSMRCAEDQSRSYDW